MTKWWQFTLSALAGAVLALVSLVLAFAGVRHDAEAAAEGVKDHETRLQLLEQIEAADTERWKNLNHRMDKQDTLLEKIVK